MHKYKIGDKVTVLKDDASGALRHLDPAAHPLDAGPYKAGDIAWVYGIMEASDFGNPDGYYIVGSEAMLDAALSGPRNLPASAISPDLIAPFVDDVDFLAAIDVGSLMKDL